MIVVEGSQMEGGGQMLRIALALSALTGQPFAAENIRRHRPQPGLKAQQLACLRALEQLSGARVEGARLGARRIVFYPGRPSGGQLVLDIGTAGAITLLLQALLLPCMFAAGPARMRLTGGTDTPWSMPVDYFVQLVVPALNRLAQVALRVHRRGFYPKGGGVVEVAIRPRWRRRDFPDFAAFLAALWAQAGPLRRIGRPPAVGVRGVSAAAEGLRAARVAERQAAAARQRLAERWPAAAAVVVKVAYHPAASPGSVITLGSVSAAGEAWVGADALGRRGRPAETVGAAAADRLLAAVGSGAAVDRHLADNLVPLLALTGGEIDCEQITGHVRAAVYVCERFLPTAFRVRVPARRIEAG